VIEHVNAIMRDLNDRDIAGARPAGNLAELALRFCLSHPAVTSVIPGMRRISSVESSCRASVGGKLDDRTKQILKRHAWDRNFYQ
jgi:aryl-alcohol dehydrogenase-like predicted oxidoreductase